MRRQGINYDTGFSPDGDGTSRTAWDPAVVRREMRVIARELHCDAVRISGGDADRLTTAAEAAAAEGLEIWFAPFPCELTREELLGFLADCARRAERLRAAGAEVVFVAGCEISMFNPGFLAGEGLYGRMNALLGAGEQWWHGEFPRVMRELEEFLAQAARAVRAAFGGRVTYAAGPWEKIDWAPFDIVGVDAYRARYNAASYREEVREHFRHGKPVAVTEFGCCTYRGAGERGGAGWTIVDRESDPPRLDGRYERDEDEQVRCLTELLAVFREEGVDAAFWFTFAGYGLPHAPDDPVHDLDMASYGVVKMLAHEPRGQARPEVGWAPKAAFAAMARLYAAGREEGRGKGA